MSWAPIQVGGLRLEAPGPYVMGVLNLTPDSFSDGGRFVDPAAAVARAFEIAAEGADLLDVGGESTRPGSAPVPLEEELRRVVPVLERLRDEGFPVPVSIDTSKAEVARAAVRAGAALVNDVSGLADPALADFVAAAGLPLVLMHVRGTPRDMQARAVYRDVAAEVREELAAVLRRAERAGVARDRILLDPGIGFAKTAPQSLELLARLPELGALGRPILVGPSRKSFIGHVTGAPVDDRLPGTLAAVALAVQGGAAVLRVHDVAAARQAARVAAAIRDAGRPPAAGEVK